jgi:hypothetical protein
MSPFNPFKSPDKNVIGVSLPEKIAKGLFGVEQSLQEKLYRKPLK